VFKQLLDKRDKAVLADSAYRSGENQTHVLEEIDADEYLMEKAQRAKPLSEEQQKRFKIAEE